MNQDMKMMIFVQNTLQKNEYLKKKTPQHYQPKHKHQPTNDYTFFRIHFCCVFRSQSVFSSSSCEYGNAYETYSKKENRNLKKSNTPYSYMK